MRFPGDRYAPSAVRVREMGAILAKAKSRKTPQAAVNGLWRNRIVSDGVKPASQFNANPLNYRTHPQSQRDAVHGSLTELGWIQRVIVNRTTGNLVDGHERVWQALHAGDAEVPYIEVELSEAEERLALAVLDPLSAMAETDAKVLNELLQEVSTGDAVLQELIASMADDAGMFDAKDGEAPELPDGDRLGFQQMTFTVADSQAEIIKRALKAAAKDGGESDVNENSNGNALAFICEAYLNG